MAPCIPASTSISPSFDLGAKKDRYAADGCAELWFVDLDADTVAQFTLRDDRTYGDPALLRRGDTIALRVLRGLAVRIDDLLGPAER